jgi:polysaccharide export outer membrane protein
MHNTGHGIRSRRKARVFPAAIVWLVAAALTPLFAQSLPPAGVPAAPAAAGDFAIGISDLLDINVLGVPDFTRELRVSTMGTIRLPFLGEVKVDGLTPAQAEAKLAGLLNPNFVKDPQVSVIIKEPRSRMFSLMGAVSRPGQYQMQESVTLVTAIAGAGGLDAKAGDIAQIQRSNKVKPDLVQHATAQVSSEEAKPAPGFQIEVDLKKLLIEGDMSRDIPIMPGDVISIPQRQVSAVYIIGDVTRPGAIDFPGGKGLKLSRALAYSGGPTKTAKLSHSALLRQKPDGSVERIALDLGKVLNGKGPDIDLQPDDLLVIPSSVGKGFGSGMLNNLPYFIMSRLIFF